MKKYPVAISNSDEGKLTLEFEKEKFADFFFSLVATPRAERKVFRGGFDLTREELKVLVEKIIHKIETDHDVLNIDFNIDIIFSNSDSLSIGSYEQFFSTSDVRSETIKQADVTLSFVIPFNRKGGEKSLEKQFISLRFESGITGELEAEIRSTEITWPAGYFSIIQDHWQLLCEQVTQQRPNYLKLFFLLSPVLRNDNMGKRSDLFSARNARLLSLMFLCGMMLILMAPIMAKIESGLDAKIYNPKTKMIQIVELNALIEEKGINKAAALIRDGDLLSLKKGIKHADNKNKLISIYKEAFFTKVSIITFLFITFYVGLNWMYAKKMDTEEVGRILLFTNKITERKNYKIVEGLIFSVFTGLITTVIVNFIVSLN